MSGGAVKMKRVMIIGCPGSGKSTFARALAEKTGLPLVYLDMLYWNPDRTTVPKTVFRERLVTAIAEEEWIIDGNYGSTIELRLAACDTVFFLDYPLETCLDGVRRRKGKERPDMPWVEYGEDAEFISFIESYRTESRPQVMELLSRYPEKNVVIFRSREEGNAFLRTLFTEK